MRSIHRRSSLLALVLVLLLGGTAVLAPAQSAVPLNKHSRKIQHELAKYRQGSYVHLVLASSPDAYGAVGPLSESGFTFTSAETNASTTYRFAEIQQVKADDQRIGHGAEPFHFRHLLPIAITTAAIAAGAITYSAMR